MHPREIVELAALVAQHGPLLIAGPARLPKAALDDYWIASKARLDCWSRALKRHATGMPVVAAEPPPPLAALVEEILTAEVLTRVWTGVLCGCDTARQALDATPIARSVLVGHAEARLRALNLLLHVRGIALDQAVSLNRLRRRAERWSDLLVGRISATSDVSEFAHDRQRAREFASDLRSSGEGPGAGQAWPLVLASLRAAFQQLSPHDAPHARLNSRIASSILACFPSEVFDSVGALRSLWMLRLFHNTDDAHGMIADLCAHDGGAPERAADARGVAAARFGKRSPHE
jgi:hypothetical protein